MKLFSKPLWLSYPFKVVAIAAACFLISLSGRAQQAVTSIVTDYLGYWKTIAILPNLIKPVNNHNLLAFTYNGIQYSTGVNDSKLSNHLEFYVAGDFWSLPVSGFTGSITSETKVGVGEMFDGVHNGPSIPPPENNINRYLTDGVKGLNIGTCIANLPAGTMSFFVSNIKPASIGDGVPDIVVTQVADPSGTFDRYSFVNSSNATVGVARDIVFTNITPVGYWTGDFYEASHNPLILESGFTNTDRPIRIWAADLADFGVTQANYTSIRKFQINLSGKSDVAFAAYNNRTFNVTVALPVKLTAFNGAESNGKIQLNWKTADEINMRDFIVEKSSNGVDFISIGTGSSNVANQYFFTDAHPGSGINYYRLKMRDTDDRFTYSTMIQVKSTSLIADISIYPNPATDGLVVSFPITSSPTMLQVHSAAGALVKQQILTAGINQATLALGEFPNGVYHLTVVSGSKKSSKIFIKK